MAGVQKLHPSALVCHFVIVKRLVNDKDRITPAHSGEVSERSLLLLTVFGHWRRETAKREDIDGWYRKRG